MNEKTFRELNFNKLIKRSEIMSKHVPDARQYWQDAGKHLNYCSGLMWDQLSIDDRDWLISIVDDLKE